MVDSQGAPAGGPDHLLGEPGQPVFYFDLGSPEAYLAAERVLSALPEVAEWQPVLAAALPGPPAAVDRDLIEVRAAQRGLMTVRWPARWPPETALAMRVATFAKQTGRTVAFAQAAFRQCFAAGRDLGDQDTVLLAAAACELHPAAVLKGSGLRSVATRLEQATAAAAAAGVLRVPAVRAGDEVFHGDGGLEAAAEALRGRAAAAG